MREAMQEVMKEPPGEAALLRFGAYELDLAAGELRKSGVLVKLQAQPLKVLALLASRCGEVVDRNEIQRRVWQPGTHVDFDQGINACIKAIRTALGDRASSPRFVETVPRRGYRFIGPVVRITGRTAEPADPSLAGGDRAEPVGLPSRQATCTVPAGPVHRVLTRFTPRRTWPVVVASSALVLLAIFVLQTASTSEREPHAAPVVYGQDRLVVLPFVALDGATDSKDYLGDALTAELISQLSRRYRNRLGVIARTSSMRYKGTDKPLAAIASELGVAYLLDGTVRRSGRRLRVTAELIRAADKTSVWADSYDRTPADLLAVQSELAETIAHALAIELLPGSPRRLTGDPAAYEAYLKGRYHLSQGKPKAAASAVAHLQRALAIDPFFAAAHAALAHAHLKSPVPAKERFRAARSAARAALTIDESNAEAHLAMASIHFYRDWDVEAARHSFERAIELDPGYAEAHHGSAAYYSVVGKHEQAIAAVQRARTLDPLSPSVNSDIGWYYYFARQYDRAIAHSRTTLELEPGYYWAHRCILFSQLLKGDLALAARAAQREMDEKSVRTGQASTADPADTLARYWQWDLERTRRYSERAPVAPSTLAMIYLGMGDRERAIVAFERSAARRAGWIMPFLRVEPMVDPLRGDPRFAAVLRQIEEPALSADFGRRKRSEELLRKSSRHR
ncbi:MAG: winged helix-turn-helix domain-containing protein [Proteobacteria bacterium]|nr:winged helix-turn-helix domain-containing protein [Pseudomonadota bacterium]